MPVLGAIVNWQQDAGLAISSTSKLRQKRTPGKNMIGRRLAEAIAGANTLVGSRAIHHFDSP